MLSSTLYDEVQELPTSSFISLKNLLNYSMDSEILLFLILCGQDSIYEKLGYSQLEALSRRIRIRYALRALSMEETGGYISHQMRDYGVQQSVFSDDTKAAIFQHSKGTWSEINALCFELITYAAARSK